MSTTRIILKNTAEILVTGGDFQTIMNKIYDARNGNYGFVNLSFDNAQTIVALDDIAGIVVEE